MPNSSRVIPTPVSIDVDVARISVKAGNGALVEPGHVAYPIRSIARDYGFSFREAEAQRIELDRRRVIADGRELPYDILVLAPGSIPNYFGNQDIQQHAISFKRLRGALSLRNRLLDAFERAEWTWRTSVSGIPAASARPPASPAPKSGHGRTGSKADTEGQVRLVGYGSWVVPLVVVRGNPGGGRLVRRDVYCVDHVEFRRIATEEIGREPVH